jgi:hypothetical protein
MMTEALPRKVTAAELKVGDVVEMFDGPWSTAIVKQVADNKVHLFRPYGTTADFTCTGGVICYTGIENYSETIADGQGRNYNKQFKLWHRANNLK